VMHALHQRHGWSIARIAREFDVAWRTARRYATAETVPRYRPRARPAELSPAQAAHVTRRLGAHPELRATTLYREVQGFGYVGSYPSFARRVRRLRPVDPQADPEVRFETDPGVQVQADWADCGRWLVGQELRTLHALVAVLGFSRMVAVRSATDTTRPTTLGLLTECLVALGGAPGEVLTDRDPALVIGATPSGRPVFAPEWVDLAEVLGIRPRAPAGLGGPRWRTLASQITTRLAASPAPSMPLVPSPAMGNDSLAIRSGSPPPAFAERRSLHPWQPSPLADAAARPKGQALEVVELQAIDEGSAVGAAAPAPIRDSQATRPICIAPRWVLNQPPLESNGRPSPIRSNALTCAVAHVPRARLASSPLASTAGRRVRTRPPWPRPRTAPGPVGA
jgi:transposase